MTSITKTHTFKQSRLVKVNPGSPEFGQKREEQHVIRCTEIGPEVERLLGDRRQKFALNSVLVVVRDESVRKLARIAPFIGHLERKGKSHYECRNFVCDLPQVVRQLKFPRKLPARRVRESFHNLYENFIDTFLKCLYSP